MRFLTFLAGNLHQSQYCDRIKVLVEFLGTKLSLDELTTIWKMQVFKHQFTMFFESSGSQKRPYYKLKTNHTCVVSVSFFSLMNWSNTLMPTILVHPLVIAIHSASVECVNIITLRVQEYKLPTVISAVIFKK